MSDIGSIDTPVRFRKQDYDTLRAECLNSKSLFSDPTFVATQASIGMPADPDPKKEVKWLRPKEISPNAVFVEGTTGTTDICQGQLGDCWLLAALSCLTMHPQLFGKVVPSDQSLAESYAGIFHFRFWQYGEWVEVVVDDRLPVRGGRLLFSYSRTLNEYWSALVEKAYAKLIGSYGSLKGGNISEGMEDFTGGIAYSLPVSSRLPRVLWRSLSNALLRGSLLSCFIKAASYREVGTVTGDGLVKGHAYAITSTDKVKSSSGETLLLRLRNPWGFIEYCGPWSDKCKDWDGVDKEEVKRIKLNLSEDGEFWISADDFSKLFDTVELCSLNPDPIVEEETATDDADGTSTPAPASGWSLSRHEASWVPGITAGGSRKFQRSYWKNPQFELILSDHDLQDGELEDEEDEGDDDDEDEVGDEDVGPVTKRREDKPRARGKSCTALLELLQKDRRRRDRVNFLPIAFHIFRVPPELRGVCLDQSFFSKNRPVGRSGKYKAVRGTWRKVKLDPGHYVIVTSTYRPNMAGDFFLRIFSRIGNTLGTQDFPCSSDFLMAVMSKPALPEDKRRVQKVFDEVAEPSGKLNAKDIRKLINSVLETDYHLPLETCRQLIFAEDTNGRSALTHDQTEPLIASLRRLQSIFIEFDEDSSGTMSPFELSLALQSAGMQIEGRVLQMLWERFGSGELDLSFSGFVSCVTRLRKLFALYEAEDSQEVKDRGINAWLLQFLAI